MSVFGMSQEQMESHMSDLREALADPEVQEALGAEVLTTVSVGGFQSLGSVRMDENPGQYLVVPLDVEDGEQ